MHMSIKKNYRVCRTIVDKTHCSFTGTHHNGQPVEFREIWTSYSHRHNCDEIADKVSRIGTVVNLVHLETWIASGTVKNPFRQSSDCFSFFFIKSKNPRGWTAIAFSWVSFPSTIPLIRTPRTPSGRSWGFKEFGDGIEMFWLKELFIFRRH